MNWYKIAQINQDNQEEIHSVSAAKFEDVKQRLEKLNKRALKLNLPPIAIKEIERKVETKKKPDRQLDPTGELGEYRDYDVEMVYFTIKGVVPKINGWRFIARIMHISPEGVQMAQNIIKAVPGEEVPEQYRKAAPDCEHCGSNRRRNDTFVLQNEQTRQYKQVGRNCLADFLRSEDPLDYVRLVDEEGSLMQFINADEEDEYGFGGGKYVQGMNIKTFVMWAMAASRKFGWVSRRKAQEEMRSATVDLLWNALFGKSSQDAKIRNEIKAVIKATDKDIAEKSVEWARNLKDDPNQQLNDYLWNLSAACSNEMVLGSTSGIVASLPVAYEKMVLSKETSQNAVPIPYKVGDKIEKDLTVMKKRSIESMYGVSILHTMQDDDGIIYKWFASKEDIDTGFKVRLKGTVKSIGPDKYENNKEVVVLTRCKVINVFAPKEETQNILSDDQAQKMMELIKQHISNFNENYFSSDYNYGLPAYLAYDIIDKNHSKIIGDTIAYGELHLIGQLAGNEKGTLEEKVATLIEGDKIDFLFDEVINDLTEKSQKSSLTAPKIQESITTLNNIRSEIKNAQNAYKQLLPVFEALKKHFEAKGKYGKWKVKEAKANKIQKFFKLI